MNCENCGAACDAGASFCGQCGKKLGPPTADTAQKLPPGASETTAWKLLSRESRTSPDVAMKIAVITAVIVVGWLLWLTLKPAVPGEKANSAPATQGMAQEPRDANPQRYP